MALSATVLEPASMVRNVRQTANSTTPAVVLAFKSDDAAAERITGHGTDCGRDLIPVFSGEPGELLLCRLCDDNGPSGLLPSGSHKYAGELESAIAPGDLPTGLVSYTSV